MTECIDISHWQGFPDFEEVAQTGVVACILKATEGTSYIDPNRVTNFLNASAAGIACSTYHWIKPGNAEAQMEFYLATLNPVQGERLVIDYEEPGCTLDDLHEAVSTLLDDPRNLKVTIYSGHLLKDQLGDSCDDLLHDHTDLWLAQYTSGEPSWPQGTYDNWTLWQYSDTGEVEGINDTFVDLNHYNGNVEQLVHWIAPSQPMTKPTQPRRRRLLIPRGPDLR